MGYSLGWYFFGSCQTTTDIRMHVTIPETALIAAKTCFSAIAGTSKRFLADNLGDASVFGINLNYLNPGWCFFDSQDILWFCQFGENSKVKRSRSLLTIGSGSPWQSPRGGRCIFPKTNGVQLTQDCLSVERILGFGVISVVVGSKCFNAGTGYPEV